MTIYIVRDGQDLCIDSIWSTVEQAIARLTEMNDKYYEVQPWELDKRDAYQDPLITGI